MKRNRNEIISEILNVCIKGASKTRVVYQANQADISRQKLGMLGALF